MCCPSRLCFRAVVIYLIIMLVTYTDSYCIIFANGTNIFINHSNCAIFYHESIIELCLINVNLVIINYNDVCMLFKYIYLYQKNVILYVFLQGNYTVYTIYISVKILTFVVLFIFLIIFFFWNNSQCIKFSFFGISIFVDLYEQWINNLLRIWEWTLLNVSCKIFYDLFRITISKCKCSI